MIQNKQLASRYAMPVIELAKEQNALETIKADADLFLSTVEENRDLRILLGSPVVKSDKKLSILTAIFAGKVSPLMEHLFRVVSANSREGVLIDVVRVISSQYNDFKNIGEGVLEVAAELDSSAISQIESKVAQLLGKDRMEFDIEVKPDLIGGFKVKLGDKQIDASVRGQLQELRNSFLR